MAGLENFLYCGRVKRRKIRREYKREQYYSSEIEGALTEYGKDGWKVVLIQKMQFVDHLNENVYEIILEKSSW